MHSVLQKQVLRFAQGDNLFWGIKARFVFRAIISPLSMRRSTASALLLLMLAAIFAPVALGTTANALPACCRAGGPHHCSAMITVPSGRGPQLRQQSCPYRKPLAFSGSAAALVASVAIAPADPHPFLHEFYPELFVSPAEQPHPQRGPPPR